MNEAILSTLLQNFTQAYSESYWQGVTENNLSDVELSKFFLAAYEKRHSDFQACLKELTLFLEIMNEKQRVVTEEQASKLYHSSLFLNSESPDTDEDSRLLHIRFLRNLIVAIERADVLDETESYVAYFNDIISASETQLVNDKKLSIYSSLLAKGSKIAAFIEEKLSPNWRNKLLSKSVRSLLSLEIKMLSIKGSKSLEKNPNLTTIDTILLAALEAYEAQSGAKAFINPKDKIEISTIIHTMGQTMSSFALPTRAEINKALESAGAFEFVELTNEAEHYIYSLEKSESDQRSQLKQLLGNGSLNSLDDLIVMALLHENGDIRSALYTATKWMKYLIRPGSKEVYELVRDSMPDNLSIFSTYNALNSEEKRDESGKIVFDESLANRLGILYHALHLMALSCDLSQELILFLVTGEYLMYGSEHGTQKRIADVFILSSLNDFNKVLTKYTA